MNIYIYIFTAEDSILMLCGLLVTPKRQPEHVYRSHCTHSRCVPGDAYCAKSFAKHDAVRAIANRKVALWSPWDEALLQSGTGFAHPHVQRTLGHGGVSVWPFVERCHLFLRCPHCAACAIELSVLHKLDGRFSHGPMPS